MQLFLLLLVALFLFPSCESSNEEARGDHEATATIEIHPSPLFTENERFTGNQVAILSTGTLQDAVAEELGIEVGDLAQLFEIVQVKDTDFIKITAYHDDEDLPKRMVECLLNIYRDFRKEREAHLASEQLEVLGHTVAKQEALVQQKRVELPVRAVGIPKVEGDQLDRLAAREEKMLEGAKAKLAEFEKARDQLLIDLEELTKLDGEQRLVYGAALDLPQNPVALSLSKSQTLLERRDELIAAGLAAAHPDVLLLAERAASAMAEAKKEVKTLFAVLQTKQELVTRQIDRMKEMLEDYWAQSERMNLLQRDYEIAREEHEDAREILRGLRLQKEKMVSAQATPETCFTIHGWVTK